VAQLIDQPWQMYATLITGAALLVALAMLGQTIWINFWRPWWAERVRREPITAHFVLRPQTPQHWYVVHDDRKHHVRTLVLPSNAEVEIEVGFSPKVPIKVNEIIFGCRGDDESKPHAQKMIARFGGSNKWEIPGQDPDHYIDIHKFYHRKRDAQYNKGTHYVLSFHVVTKAPGLYKVSISLLTDQVQGSYGGLSLLVEERPKTRMKCVEHTRCYVRPKVRVA
jgi:hypothetical protein